MKHLDFLTTWAFPHPKVRCCFSSLWKTETCVYGILTTAVLLLFCIIHSSLPPDALPATCLAVTSLKTAYAVGSLLQTNWKARAPTSYSRKFTVAGLRRGVTPWTFRKVTSLMYRYAAKQLPRSPCKCIQLEFSFSMNISCLSTKFIPKHADRERKANGCCGWNVSQILWISLTHPEPTEANL